MSTNNYNEQHLSNEARDKLTAYKEKNALLQQSVQAFLDNHSDEMAEFDQLREDRNEALDDLRKQLRADAVENTEINRIVIEDFVVQKKWSSWYVVEQFVELAQANGMYDSAVAEGVIVEKTEVNGKLAEEWLRKNSLEDTFNVCLDGKELTPAVSGPKEMLPFGAERK